MAVPPVCEQRIVARADHVWLDDFASAMFSPIGLAVDGDGSPDVAAGP